MKKNLLFRTAILIIALNFVAHTIHAQTYQVKKVEFEKRETSSWGYGEIEKYWVSYTDGTTGYICYSPKCGVWYIYNGSGGVWEYTSKEKAIKALYIYKRNDGEISNDGKTKVRC